MASEKGLWSYNNDYLWFQNIYFQNDLQEHVIPVKLQCNFPIKLYMTIKAQKGVRAVSQAGMKTVDSSSSSSSTNTAWTVKSLRAHVS